MVAPSDRTARDWFDDAARVYVEGHQACVWCGSSHRVFKTQRNGRLEYHCYSCDFYVCYKPGVRQYFMAPGEEEAAKVPSELRLEAC